MFLGDCKKIKDGDTDSHLLLRTDDPIHLFFPACLLVKLWSSHLPPAFDLSLYHQLK
jgi:hypothetical protein